MSTVSMSVVLIEGASKDYGDHTVVDDVSFAVPAGRCLALIGHNGAGKTTLMKLILGLATPTRGRLQVLGVDPARADKSFRRQLGFLPENVVAAHDLIETVRMVAKNHDATASQVALAWVVSHPNVVAIPGASSLAQLESNVAAADLQLHDDEIAELTAVSDAFHPVRGPAAGVKLIKRRIRR